MTDINYHVPTAPLGTRGMQVQVPVTAYQWEKYVPGRPFATTVEVILKSD